MAVVCPECDNPLDIDTATVQDGETMECSECGAELEIVSADPLDIAVIDKGEVDEVEERRSIDQDE